MNRPHGPYHPEVAHLPTGWWYRPCTQVHRTRVTGRKGREIVNIFMDRNNIANTNKTIRNIDTSYNNIEIVKKFIGLNKPLYN